MNMILKKISTRDADFEKMSLDERLETICNCIELFLKPHKKSDKFIILDYSDTLGYLSDEVVKEFRKRLECFRHSTKEDLIKRKQITIEQKKFLINYGLLIINYINGKING